MHWEREYSEDIFKCCGSRQWCTAVLRGVVPVLSPMTNGGPTLRIIADDATEINLFSTMFLLCTRNQWKYVSFKWIFVKNKKKIKSETLKGDKE